MSTTRSIPLTSAPSLLAHNSYGENVSSNEGHFSFTTPTRAQAYEQSWTAREEKVEEGGQVKLDRDLRTRNLSILGLMVGWCIAITSITIGVCIVKAGPVQVPSFLLSRVAVVGSLGYSWIPTSKPNPYIRDHRVYRMSHAGMILLTLLFNVCLTYIFESINYIHATSLRWQLWQEGRLFYNSNPRLLSTTKRYGPNHWTSNITSCLALILGFGGLTNLTFPVYIASTAEVVGKKFITHPNPPGPRYAIDFDAWGMIGLGSGVLLQSVLSTWCLLQKVPIGTWNSNPLAVARACKYLAETQSDTASMSANRHGLSELDASGHDSFASLQSHTPIRPQLHHRSSSSISHILVCSRPQTRQPSASQVIPKTRTIARVVWLLFALVALWTCIIAIIASHDKTTTTKYVLAQAGKLDFLAYWQYFGQVKIRYTTNYYNTRREWMGLAFQCLAISLPLVGLHYSEVLTALCRDEAIWRRAAAPATITTTAAATTIKPKPVPRPPVGARPDAAILLEDARFWPCWLLFALKLLAPWVFGFGFACIGKVFMSLLPMLAFALLYLVLAVFSTYLIARAPRGPQPPTYGNIRDLGGLVEEWGHERIFWGDKGPWEKGVRVAGTAGEVLPALRAEGMYTGLRLGRTAPVGRTVDVFRGFAV